MQALTGRTIRTSQNGSYKSKFNWKFVICVLVIKTEPVAPVVACVDVGRITDVQVLAKYGVKFVHVRSVL